MMSELNHEFNVLCGKLVVSVLGFMGGLITFELLYRREYLHACIVTLITCLVAGLAGCFVYYINTKIDIIIDKYMDGDGDDEY